MKICLQAVPIGDTIFLGLGSSIGWFCRPSLLEQGRFCFGVAISVSLVYNMFNKAADTIDHTYPFPAL